MYRRLIFPVLSQYDAETVHERTLALLQLGSGSEAVRSIIHRLFSRQDPRLQVETMGLEFANPLGLAAGFDKNAAAVATLAALGFGHVEAGTIPPQPQPGNSKPRLFRLIKDQALINRMGFNSLGANVAEDNLRRVRKRDFILGINIGANKSSVDAGTAVDDYSAALHQLAWYGDYVTINVSSPNTARLRDLQGKEALTQLIQHVIDERNSHFPGKPVLIKIAPDLTHREIYDILEVVDSHGVQGVIATNTTVARPESLASASKGEIGGLSGGPLKEKALAVVRYIYELTNGQLPIIGVGGVFTWQDVIHMMMAGASLVQIFTGFIYEGPGVSKAINLGLVQFIEREGLRSIQEIVGQAV